MRPKKKKKKRIEKTERKVILGEIAKYVVPIVSSRAETPFLCLYMWEHYSAGGAQRHQGGEGVRAAGEGAG